MEKFEYRIEKVSGIFTPRSAKETQIESLCAVNGEEGWELVSVTYDWFFVSYTLYFKRKI
ncbi:MAG: hypothetical protein ACPGR2_04290 [Psychrobium sp.]